MLELSTNSAKQILGYLKSSLHIGVSNKDLAAHITKLGKYQQIDAAEDTDHKLIYACAWWMVTDKAIDDLKIGKLPKRFNRGRNLVSLFWYAPQNDIDAQNMRQIIRRVVRMERAKTINFFDENGKLITFHIGQSVNKDNKLKTEAAFKAMGFAA